MRVYLGRQSLVVILPVPNLAPSGELRDLLTNNEICIPTPQTVGPDYDKVRGKWREVLWGFIFLSLYLWDLYNTCQKQKDDLDTLSWLIPRKGKGTSLPFQLEGSSGVIKSSFSKAQDPTMFICSPFSE